MNKKQYIECFKKEFAEKFGRFAFPKNSKRATMNIFAEPPKNQEEVLQHGNALARSGNYPVGTDACFNVGISGGCGRECFVFKEGDCPEPDGI